MNNLTKHENLTKLEQFSEAWKLNEFRTVLKNYENLTRNEQLKKNRPVLLKLLFRLFFYFAEIFGNIKIEVAPNMRGPELELIDPLVCRYKHKTRKTICQ